MYTKPVAQHWLLHFAVLQNACPGQRRCAPLLTIASNTIFNAKELQPDKVRQRCLFGWKLCRITTAAVFLVENQYFRFQLLWTSGKI